MTFIRAKNSLHKRVFDTSKFWWAADAWDQRTLEWFTTEQGKSSRIQPLLQALDDRRLSTIPGLQPPADWIVGLLEGSSITTLGVGQVTPRQWLQAAVERHPPTYSHSGRYTNQFAKYQTAVPVLIRSLRLSHEDLDELSVLEAPEAILGNATLPELPTKIPGSLTPYHALLEEKLSAWKNRTVLGQTYETSSLVNSLLSNPGATTEDLLAAWDLLQGVATTEEDGLSARQQYERFIATLLSHPNWDQQLAGSPIPSKLITLEGRVEWPTGMMVPPGGQNGPTQQLIGRDPVLNGTYDNSSQEFIFRRSRSSCLAVVAKGLAAWTNDIPRVNGATRARIAAGYFAPVLGAYFSELATKYGTDDIPLEWLIELT